jgi:hypothetical protein
VVVGVLLQGLHTVADTESKQASDFDHHLLPRSVPPAHIELQR